MVLELEAKNQAYNAAIAKAHLEALFKDAQGSDSIDDPKKGLEPAFLCREEEWRIQVLDPNTG